MQSRISYGGFMKPITHFKELRFIGIAYGSWFTFKEIKEVPIETKVGAIPANFFFSL
jgi:hypothetical protein